MHQTLEIKEAHLVNQRLIEESKGREVKSYPTEDTDIIS